ncbi:MAG: hypothetical protein AAGG08_13875 [Actinomycetota bacterium]
MVRSAMVVIALAVGLSSSLGAGATDDGLRVAVSTPDVGDRRITGLSSDHDGSVVVLSTDDGVDGGEPFIYDFDTGTTSGPQPPGLVISPSGRFGFSQSGADSELIVRRDFATGDVRLIEPMLGNGYRFTVVGSSADGELIALDAISSTLGRDVPARVINLFVVNADGEVLTPGAQGISESPDLLSSLHHVDPGGRFVAYYEWSLGGDAVRYVRWDRRSGHQQRFEAPADRDEFSGAWVASPSLTYFAYPTTHGEFVVVDHSTGTRSVVPVDPADVVFAAVTDRGDLVVTVREPGPRGLNNLMRWSVDDPRLEPFPPPGLGVDPSAIWGVRVSDDGTSVLIVPAESSGLGAEGRSIIRIQFRAPLTLDRISVPADVLQPAVRLSARP